MTGAGRKEAARLIGRAVVLGFALAAVLYAIEEGIGQAHSAWAPQFGFDHGDWQGYLDGARRFLATGTPYAPEQLGAHWQLEPHSFIHPPLALALFIPFLWLPVILWWIIPLAGTAIIVALARPGPWRVLAIALCVAWPRTIGALEAGNSDIWAMFFVALGTRFGWPVVFLAIKPTFVPVGLLWAGDRRTWIAAGIVSLAMLPLIPLWLQWLHVVTTAGLDYTYSVPSLPLIVLPVIGGLRALPDRRAVARGLARRGRAEPTGPALPLDGSRTGDAVSSAARSR